MQENHFGHFSNVNKQGTLRTCGRKKKRERERVARGALGSLYIMRRGRERERDREDSPEEVG